MQKPVLEIVTKPELSSNKRLEEEFTADIFRRVERTRHSRRPKFIFFRPQGRPKEEFDENIAPLLKKEQYNNDAIIVSISNNTEKSDAYLVETGFTFKLKVKLILTEGELGGRNEETFLKLTNILIDEYRFKIFGETEETNNEESYPEAKKVLIYLMSEATRKAADIRKQLKEFEPLMLLILNDDNSQYTTSLLSALEDVETPYKQMEMKSRQFHGFEWEKHWIVDLGSVEVDDLGDALLAHFSRSKSVCIVCVQPWGSDSKELHMKFKSLRKGPPRHIVVIMDTMDDCPEESPKVKGERKRVSDATKIPANQIHFVRNYTDTRTDSNTDLIHLAVLSNIMDNVKQQSALMKSARSWYWGYVLVLISTCVLVPAAACALSTSCLQNVCKMPGMIVQTVNNSFKCLVQCVRSGKNFIRVEEN